MQHSSFSSSPPSHNSLPTAGLPSSVGGILTSPGASSRRHCCSRMRRRRNSLNRLAPLAGVGTETVMEGPRGARERTGGESQLVQQRQAEGGTK